MHVKYLNDTEDKQMAVVIDLEQATSTTKEEELLGERCVVRDRSDEKLVHRREPQEGRYRVHLYCLSTC